MDDGLHPTLDYTYEIYEREDFAWCTVPTCRGRNPRGTRSGKNEVLKRVVPFCFQGVLSYPKSLSGTLARQTNRAGHPSGRYDGSTICFSHPERTRVRVPHTLHDHSAASTMRESSNSEIIAAAARTLLFRNTWYPAFAQKNYNVPLTTSI